MDVLKLRTIPTDNILNLRSLGGYATDDGHMTKFGTFYRSGWMKSASESDIEKITQLGIKTVVDLRSSFELEKVPNNLPKENGISYVHIDILGKLDPSEMEKTMKTAKSDGQFILLDLYKYVLQNQQDSLKKLFTTLSDSISKGAVMFNCSAGKDRTGMTAMFLLSIARVGTLDIIADYEVSSTYIQGHYDSEIMGSDPKNMIELLKYIGENYGSAVEYLKSIGVSESEIQTIRDNFLE